MNMYQFQTLKFDGSPSGLTNFGGGKGVKSGMDIFAGIGDALSPYTPDSAPPAANQGATAINNAAAALTNTPAVSATDTMTPDVPNTVSAPNIYSGASGEIQPGLASAFQAMHAPLSQEQLHYNDPDVAAARAAAQAADPDGWIRQLQAAMESLGAGNQSRFAAHQYDQSVARDTANDTIATMERMARANPANYSGQIYIGPTSFNYSPTTGMG